MKSLLVTSGVSGTDLSNLARGAWCIVTSTGAVQTTVPTSGMYKYVVGVGNGKNIEGLWLNAENKAASKQTYSTGGAKTVTISEFKVNTDLASEATVHIQTQPKNSLSGNTYQEFVATVPIVSTTQTEETVAEDMLVQVQKVLADITAYFGKEVIEIATTDPTTITGLKLVASNTDFNFYVNFGGAATGKTTETNSLTFGTQAEVIKLEKELAVTTFGYNPNFDAGDEAYGDVMMAGEFGANGYDIIVVTAVANATDQMPLYPNGANVEQWIAVPTGNSTLKY